MSTIKNSFTEEQRKEAKKFCDFYVDLIEKHSDYMGQHLADDITLDWFGQTVKGIKNVSAFMRANVINTKHFFTDAQPVSSVGSRDTHGVNTRKSHAKRIVPVSYSVSNKNEKTPPKNTVPYASTSQERGQGDGVHNCDSPVSPIKRGRFDHGDTDEKIPICGLTTDETLPVKYMSVKGSIEFRKNSSKKLQTETKWERPCKLEVAYTCHSVDDSRIHLIIYQGNMKCRRNLLREFEKNESQE